jgi:DNA-binding XRE family transcriptional regulator
MSDKKLVVRLSIESNVRCFKIRMNSVFWWRVTLYCNKSLLGLIAFEPEDGKIKVSRNPEDTKLATSHDQLVFAIAMVLRDRREGLDISQSDLARRSGLHRSYIGDLERGARNLSVRNLSRLAEALEMNASKALSQAEKRLASDGPFKIKKRKKIATAANLRGMK